MTFSIVIPTLNRPDVLEETLVSIRKQSRQPERIVIIDQSSDNRTKVLCRQYREVLYIHSTVKSSSIARNTGIDTVDSAIVFFLDDDVELLPDYFKTILNTYEKDDSIVGVQGWVRKYHSFGRVSNLIRKVFLFEHDSGRMRLLSTFLGTNFEKRPPETTEIEWCNGCGFSVRTSIAKKEKFEAYFFLYSLAEDRDFSYRCSKYGKLLMNPAAEMIHKVVNISRLPSEKKTRMTYVHQMYLIAKNHGWSF